jgi:hypothetical protein
MTANGTKKGYEYTLRFSDELLKRLQRAQAEESARKLSPVPMSDIIRHAILLGLERMHG